MLSAVPESSKVEGHLKALLKKVNFVRYWLEWRDDLLETLGQVESTVEDHQPIDVTPPPAGLLSLVQ